MVRSRLENVKGNTSLAWALLGVGKVRQKRDQIPLAKWANTRLLIGARCYGDSLFTIFWKFHIFSPFFGCFFSNLGPIFHRNWNEFPMTSQEKVEHVQDGSPAPAQASTRKQDSYLLRAQQ